MPATDPKSNREKMTQIMFDDVILNRVNRGKSSCRGRRFWGRKLAFLSDDLRGEVTGAVGVVMPGGGTTGGYMPDTYEDDPTGGCGGADQQIKLTARGVELTSGEEDDVAPNGNALIGVGLTTLGQLCFLLDTKDLEGLSKAIDQTVEQIQAIGIEAVLGWHSRCAQLATQTAVDALPAAGVTGAADTGGGGNNVSWADGMLAVCALLFVVVLAAFVRAYARGITARAAKYGEGDAEDAREARGSVAFPRGSEVAGGRGSISEL